MLFFLQDATLDVNGCFNKSIWDPKIGREFTEKTIDNIIEWSKEPCIDHLSILGGEPTAAYNIEAVIHLCRRYKSEFPDRLIWLWSGRFKEEIEKLPHGKELLDCIDVLIDGPFIEEKKDLSLKWRRFIKSKNLVFE